MSASEEEEGRKFMGRMIPQMTAGPTLDKLVGFVVFQMKSEECPEKPGTFHLQGSQHYVSKIATSKNCTLPMPAFSTDWDAFKILLEWMVLHFPGVEMSWDCDRWTCNVNVTDKKGCWFRVASAHGFTGMQEAVCKAALLTLVNPQEKPLEFTSRVVEVPVRRKVAAKTRRKKK